MQNQELGEVEKKQKKQKKREKEPKDNRNLYLAREEIQFCFSINHHTMVSIYEELLLLRE